MAKPVWTDAQIINQIDSGDTWSGLNLTYAFATDVSWFPYSEKNGFSPLNSSQQAVATQAIQLWDDLIAPNFTLSSDATTANIVYANTTATGDYAHTYYPDGTADAGTVWFNPEWNSTTGTNDLVTPVRGEWGYVSYIHETGHAFGLNHPGNYNGGNPTYAANALYSHDTQMYSVMSYFTADNTGADWIASDGHEYYPQTPMMDDIMVIQTMYGADTTTRAGNTTYGFNSNAGESVYDFTSNQHPILCIYDAGGNDTIDLSGWNTSCRIDLTPGSFSDAATMTDNISISRTTWIENAVGGGGNDTLTGNSINNTLTGNAGNDTIDGAAGDDVLNGGIGNDILYGGTGNDILTGGVGNDQIHGDGNADTVVFTDSYANYLITYDTVNGDYIVADNLSGSTDGTDLVWDVESFVFLDFTVSTVGQTLSGTTGGDTLVGGLGNDIFVIDNALDKIVDGSGIDTVVSSISFSLANSAHVTGAVENLALTGTAPINATGNALNNILVGNSAANVIDGGAGSDWMQGGAGNDTYVVDNINDTVDETSNGGAGVDTVVSTVSFSLADTVHAWGAVENLALTGTAAINATGNALNNILVGNGAANVIDGGAGSDWMQGGAGDDTYIVDNINDSADEASNGGAGIDTVMSSVSFSLADTVHVKGAVENLTLSGTAAINATGNSLANIIIGNSGNNIIEGGAGSDTLSGGGGHDTFIFRLGFGADVVTDFTAGAGVNDILEVHSATITNLASVLSHATDTAAGVVIDFGGGDTLTLTGVQKSMLAADDFSFLSP